MATTTSSKSKRWMSLGEVCSLLEVNETTLRQWADSGRIRCYRTPGGHRRFSAEAVRSLIARGNEPAGNGREPRWTDTAIQRVRRRLKSNQTASQHWYQSMDETTRSRMRLLGRRLLSIAADYSTQHRMRADLVEEARLIGEEYGAEMTRQGTSLRDALEAFVFFRTFLLENVLGNDYAASGGSSQLWRSVNLLADQMLLSLASCYEAAHPTSPQSASKEI